MTNKTNFRHPAIVKVVGTRKQKPKQSPWISERIDADKDTPGGHLLAVAKKKRAPWPDWGDDPDGFDGPGGAE